MPRDQRDSPLLRQVRPEWLYEVVNRVQSLVLPHTEDVSTVLAETLVITMPAESELERLIFEAFQKRLVVEWKAHSTASHGTRIVPRHRAAGMPSRVYVQVLNAKAVLETQCERHWTLELLAREVGGNRTDLEAGFKMMGLRTIHSHLTVCRIRKACTLLATTYWRIDEVARAVGYRSKGAFYVNFRRIVGMQPHSYRRRWAFVPATPDVLGLSFSNGS